MVRNPNYGRQHGWCRELGVAEKMSEFDMITCLTKQHDVKKLKQYKIKSIYKNIALSIGIKKEDFTA